MALLSCLVRHACSCGLDGRWMISVSMITIDDIWVFSSYPIFFSSYQTQNKSRTLSCFHNECNLLIPRMPLVHSEPIWENFIAPWPCFQGH